MPKKEKQKAKADDLYEAFNSGYDQVDDEGLEDDDVIHYELHDREYYLKVSDASFDLDDVQAFVVGPATSRFWMLRKYINSLSAEQVKKYGMPFYSWQCITI